MIDNFALLISHGLMMVVAWRLLQRRDVDRDDGTDARPSFRQRRPGSRQG